MNPDSVPSLLPWLSVAQNAAFGLDFACRGGVAHPHIDARVAAVAAAAVALTLRAPFLVVVVVGAATAAIIRALGG